MKTIAVLIIVLLMPVPLYAQTADVIIASETGQTFFRNMSWGALGAGAALKTWEAFHADDKKKALAAEGLGFAATGLLTLGVKYLTHEDRPCAPADCGSDDPHKSFWSGHTANACFAIPTVSSKGLIIAGGVLAGLVAVGRIAGNRHFWWDTAAGCADGLATNVLMKRAFNVRRTDGA